MANPEVEHLGIMAYAAHLQWVPPRPPLSDLINVLMESNSGRVGEPHTSASTCSRAISVSVR
ncbi:unnamed protein product [Ceratitis capitata]|uniref:(Mediterranean fruit fly) hypothetical protein n=1 Tax=Ceratitis capitata TaxID=7213 RepID=A0A811VJ69_CERCA|nr:unnamed protein product [Ceratitis capitata]